MPLRNFLGLFLEYLIVYKELQKRFGLQGVGCRFEMYSLIREEIPDFREMIPFLRLFSGRYQIHTVLI